MHANRTHANAPTILSATDRAKLRANIAQKATPRYSVADLLRHAAMFTACAIAATVIL